MDTHSRVLNVLREIRESPENKDLRCLRTNDYYKGDSPRWTNLELNQLIQAGFEAKNSKHNPRKRVLFLKRSRVSKAIKILANLEKSSILQSLDAKRQSVTPCVSASPMQHSKSTRRNPAHKRQPNDGNSKSTLSGKRQRKVIDEANVSSSSQFIHANTDQALSSRPSKSQRVNPSIREKRRSRTNSRGRRKQKQKNFSSSPLKKVKVFQGVKVVLIPGGKDLSSQRAKLLKNLIVENGGSVFEVEDIATNPSAFIVVASALISFERIPRIAQSTRVVSPEWISSCIRRIIVPKATIFDRVDRPSSSVRNDNNLDNSASIDPNMLTSTTKFASRNQSEDKAEVQDSSSQNQLPYAILKVLDDDIENGREVLKRKRSSFFSTPIVRPENTLTIEEFREAVRKNTWVDKRKDSLACQTNLGEYGGHAYNANGHITKVLKDLMSIYEALAIAPLYNDRGGRKTKGNEFYWKVFSMKKVIGILENHPVPLRTREDLEALQIEFQKRSKGGRGRRQGIGKKTWDKIWEIMKTGRLQRIDVHMMDSRIRTILDFTKIWGVGATTAAKLYKRGFRSIEDLRARQDEAKLTNNQRIGLRHYDDLQKRIPRSEVEHIEAFVRKHAEAELSGVTVVTCGSYRRGSPHSGDVDILMSHTTNTTELLSTFLPGLVARLRNSGFLTDELSHGYFNSKRRHESATCFGVCRLPTLKDGKPRAYRRLDLKVYPRIQFAFAILYFTGSDHFNRSMRWYAHKKGLSLSDNGLRRATRVNRERIWEGPSVFCETEADIFEALSLEYVPPQMRNVQQGSNKVVEEETKNDYEDSKKFSDTP